MMLTVVRANGLNGGAGSLRDPVEPDGFSPTRASGGRQRDRQQRGNDGDRPIGGVIDALAPSRHAGDLGAIIVDGGGDRFRAGFRQRRYRYRGCIVGHGGLLLAPQGRKIERRSRRTSPFALTPGGFCCQRPTTSATTIFAKADRDVASAARCAPDRSRRPTPGSAARPRVLFGFGPSRSGFAWMIGAGALLLGSDHSGSKEVACSNRCKSDLAQF